MSYSEAKSLLSALEITNIDENFEIAIEVIEKYGSYKKALQATIGISYKKKEALLIALLGSEDDQNESTHSKEAKRLIYLVYTINNQVFKDSEKFSITFSDLMKQIKLNEMIYSEDLAILNAVKPHRDAKLLISSINAYQDGNIQLQAFTDALKYKKDDVALIANPIENLRIKR